MNRREFITATVAASCAAGLAVMETQAGAQEERGRRVNREYYELRKYIFANADKAKAFEPYLREALLPALKRAGCGPVGVFAPQTEQTPPYLYVLIPHRSPESAVTLVDRLANDSAYQSAAAPMFALPQKDPAYARIESALFVAFEGMPKLNKPAQRARYFELRTYESQNEKAAKAKIKMFNISEIAIFKKVGLKMVFFGERLYGPQMPNLTYMLVYDDKADHDKGWAGFGADPDWQKLRVTPGFTDPETVSHIDSVFLNPLEFSEI